MPLRLNLKKEMGCNQSSANSVPQSNDTPCIPCHSDDIGRYLNDVRANPSKYADLLEKELQNFTDEYSLAIGKDVVYRTSEGKAAWKETIEFLRKAEPLPPLQKHEGLCKAAAYHAQDLSRREELSHTGSDATEPLDRLVKFCKMGYGKTGETIGTDFRIEGRNCAQNTVLGLVIDDGMSDRGHRLSIFDKDFAYFGSETRAQGDKIITVINYLSENWEQVKQFS